MSRVRKLSIRGIRNFSDTDEAIIQFHGPLTLITGLNGVGKTTVIECLRYVTTGEFPPNSDRGKSFIHDPMLKKQISVQVRACVKGQFIDREGKTITVTRTIESSRYEKQCKFKTLDNAVTVYNPKTKEETQLTNRCADVDVEVMNSLGVSSAILNHVIFCHQDDANWPLDDNKTIKDRFDAILETSHYNKALERLRKLGKAKGVALKIAQADQNTLAERIAGILAKEEKLNDFKQRKTDITKRIEKMNKQLDPIKERLNEIKKIEADFQKLKADEEKDEIAYNMADEQCESLRLRVKEIYEGSDAELGEEIASYGSTLQQKNRKIAGIENAIKDLQMKEQNCSKILADHRVLMGTLRQQMEDQEKKVMERNQVLNSALSIWKLDSLDSFDDENEIQRAIESVESKTQEFESSINTKIMKQNQQENLQEKAVDAARDQRSKINSELQRSEEEAEEIRNTIYNTRLKIGQSVDSDKRLDAVDAKLVQMDQEIKDINKLMKSEDLEEKITKETKNSEQIEEKFTKLDEEMTLIQNQSALNVKLEALKSNFQAKTEDIDKMKEKHEEHIKKLLKKDGVPEYNLKETIEAAQGVLSERLEKLSTEIKAKEYELMTVETALAHYKKELNAKISDNEYEKEKVKAHCENYRNYEEALLDQQTKLKEVQDRSGMLTHEGSAYNTYIKELTRNSCCALCERHFDSDSDAQKLLKKLKEGIADLPQRLRQCNRELDIDQEKYNTLVSIKSIVEAIIKFEDVDKEQMTKKIKQKEHEVEDLKRKITELKELKLEPERRIEIAQNMIPDLTIWDRYSQDLLQIDIAMDELQEEMSSRGRTSNKTMEQIQTEKEALKKTLKKARDTISELRSTLDNRKELLRRATEKRTKCLEEQLRIHNEAQQLRKLKDDLKAMIIKETTLRASIQTLRQQLMTAEEERAEAIRALDELKCKNRTVQKNDRKQMKEYEKQWDTLNSLQAEITDFSSRNIKKLLQNLESDVKRHQQTCIEKQREKSEKENELSQIKEDISCHETKKRNLTDNVELRKYEKTIKQLKESCRQRKIKINRLNYDDVIREKTLLLRDAQTFEGEVNKASGIRGEIDTNINQVTQELNTKECKSARTDYRAKCTEVLVTKHAIDDVTTFATVLDRATAEVHVERLNKINSAMKKLWMLIYSGNDTKSIQIRAEATSTTGATDRRQFNYKLVQVKHGVEMEMRGRCSAGQRVLASIILRLALAETLSQQCGILALDEPTTNLDIVNAGKLADALYKYVSWRAKFEKNFQLIIITHDQNFIKHLSELTSSHSAQELYRMENGLTNVRRTMLNGNEDTYYHDQQAEYENEPETQQMISRKRTHAGDGPSGTSKKAPPYIFDLDDL